MTQTKISSLLCFEAPRISHSPRRSQFSLLSQPWIHWNSIHPEHSSQCTKGAHRVQLGALLSSVTFTCQVILSASLTHSTFYLQARHCVFNKTRTLIFPERSVRQDSLFGCPDTVTQHKFFSAETQHEASKIHECSLSLVSGCSGAETRRTPFHSHLSLNCVLLCE